MTQGQVIGQPTIVSNDSQSATISPAAISYDTNIGVNPQVTKRTYLLIQGVERRQISKAAQETIMR